MLRRLAQKGRLQRVAQGSYEPLLADTGGIALHNPWAALAAWSAAHYVSFAAAAYELGLTPGRPAMIAVCAAVWPADAFGRPPALRLAGTYPEALQGGAERGARSGSGGRCGANGLRAARAPLRDNQAIDLRVADQEVVLVLARRRAQSYVRFGAALAGSPGESVAASFVLKAWLQADGERDAVREHVARWLALHGERMDASFVLTGWLMAGGEPQLVVETVKRWCDLYGTTVAAGYVWRAWGVSETNALCNRSN